MIEVRELALKDPEGRWLLQDLACSVPKGGKLLLTGPSGAGKSRLLRVIGGVERPRRGTVTVGGQRVWPGDGALALFGAPVPLADPARAAARAALPSPSAWIRTGFRCR